MEFDLVDPEAALIDLPQTRREFIGQAPQLHRLHGAIGRAGQLQPLRSRVDAGAGYRLPQGQVFAKKFRSPKGGGWFSGVRASTAQSLSIDCPPRAAAPPSSQ